MKLNGNYPWQTANSVYFEMCPVCIQHHQRASLSYMMEQHMGLLCPYVIIIRLKV